MIQFRILRFQNVFYQNLHGISGVWNIPIAGQGITGLLIEAISDVGIFAVAQGPRSNVARLIKVFHLGASATWSHW